MSGRRLFVALVAVPAIGMVGLIDMRDPATMSEPVLADTFPPVVSAIVEPATPGIPPSQASRLDIPTVLIPPETLVAPTSSWVLPDPVPAGLWGLPFAPDGLDECAEASWYRQQWGLPDVFDGIAFRESRCIAREDVRTSCCVSRYQLYVRLHLRDDTLRLRYEACEVFDETDLDGPQPIEQQRAACATRALFDLAGLAPWRLP